MRYVVCCYRNLTARIGYPEWRNIRRNREQRKQGKHEKDWLYRTGFSFELEYGTYSICRKW